MDSPRNIPGIIILTRVAHNSSNCTFPGKAILWSHVNSFKVTNTLSMGVTRGGSGGSVEPPFQNE